MRFRPLLVLGLALALASLARAGDEPVPPQRRVAVTVDDLPLGGSNVSLADLKTINRAIIDELVREGVPAVGFVNEGKLHYTENVEPRVSILRMWTQAGLELGNHTYSHPDLNKVGVAAYKADLIRGEPITRKLLAEQGRTLRWFRHCFLRTGKTAEDKAAFDVFLAERGYRVAPVTVENDDWQFNGAWVAARTAGDTALAVRIGEAYVAHWTTALAYYEGLSRDLFGREIPQVLLLHDNALNAEYLDDLLGLLRTRGYTFVSLDDALADPAYAHPDTYVGSWGKSWLHRWWISEGRPSRLKEHPFPPEWVGGR